MLVIAAVFVEFECVGSVWGCSFCQ